MWLPRMAPANHIPAAIGLRKISDRMPSLHSGHVFAAVGRRPAQVSKAAAQWNGVQPARFAGDGRSAAEDSSLVVLPAGVVERSGGFFVPIGMVIQ